MLSNNEKQHLKNKLWPENLLRGWLHHTNAEYQSGPGIGSRSLSMATKSALLGAWNMLQTCEDRDALRIGSALHGMLLENTWPEVFVPQTRQKNRERAALQQQRNADEGILLSQVEYEQVSRMYEELVSHAEIRNIFSEGDKEISGYLPSNELGTRHSVQLRIRPDLRRDGLIVDLKTTAFFDRFDAAAVDHSYIDQACYYLMVTEALEEKPFDFVWVVVEKQPPWRVSIIMLPRILYENRRGSLLLAVDALADFAESEENSSLLIRELKPPVWWVREA